MFLDKLISLLTKAHISVGMYAIYDKNDTLLAGRHGRGLQLDYHDNWRVRDIEESRGNVSYEKHCDTVREACIEFLKMTDDEFHLASHIPEFAE